MHSSHVANNHKSTSNGTWSNHSNHSTHSSRGQRSSHSQNYRNYRNKPFTRSGTGNHNIGRTFFEIMGARIENTFANFAGQRVLVQKKNGELFEGVLIATSDETKAGFSICLDQVLQVTKDNAVLKSYEGRLVMKWNEIGFISGNSTPISSENQHQNFETDVEISNFSSLKDGKGSERNLKAVDPSWLKEKAVDSSLNDSGAIRNWNQFKANKEKFGVDASFDENVYTTKLDKSKLTKDQVLQAEQKAEEIQNQVRKNVDDLKPEEKFAAVQKKTVQMSWAARLKKTADPKTLTSRNEPSEPKIEPLKSETPKKTVQINEGSSGLQTPKSNKSFKGRYEVSDIDFNKHLQQRRLAQKMEAESRRNMALPKGSTKDRALIQKQRSMNKTKEDQIKEFREFSASLEKKSQKEKKLNVNAKEFQPKDLFQAKKSVSSNEPMNPVPPPNPPSKPRASSKGAHAAGGNQRKSSVGKQVSNSNIVVPGAAGANFVNSPGQPGQPGQAQYYNVPLNNMGMMMPMGFNPMLMNPGLVFPNQVNPMMPNMGAANLQNPNFANMNNNPQNMMMQNMMQQNMFPNMNVFNPNLMPNNPNFNPQMLQNQNLNQNMVNRNAGQQMPSNMVQSPPGQGQPIPNFQMNPGVPMMMQGNQFVPVVLPNQNAQQQSQQQQLQQNQQHMNFNQHRGAKLEQVDK
eukprot:snap_masked-scaffold_10-processed-gene-11.20-mRNA-1 protein AED:1.00 eAED:1.00 QI:0/-1/0/0/-1/1/1/0/685